MTPVTSVYQAFQMQPGYGLLLDLDGTLYHGSKPSPGAVELIEWIHVHRINYLLVTNNSSRTPEQLTHHLEQLGVGTIPPDRILTSALATAEYLKIHARPHATVFIIGEDGLFAAIEGAGFSVSEEDPEYVVVGLDRDLKFSKVEVAVKAIRNGSRFIATNSDRVLATEVGFLPGTGSIVAMVQSETDREPIYIGKPSSLMFELAARKLQRPLSALIMVGDDIRTDVAGAQELGMRTMLVLGGATSLDQLSISDISPDYVVEDLHALVHVLDF